MSERDGWMDRGCGTCPVASTGCSFRAFWVFFNGVTLIKYADDGVFCKSKNPSEVTFNAAALQVIFILCGGPSFGNIHDLIRNTNRPQVLDTGELLQTTLPSNN